MNAERLRGALVGAGNVTRFHMRAWRRIPEASIVAIADPNLEKAQARGREFDIDAGRVYPGLADLLEVKTNLAEARAMIQICQDAGVVLNVNENWRWRPITRPNTTR